MSVVIECDVCGETAAKEEMEEFIDESQGLKIYACNSCIKDAERREAYEEQIIDMRFQAKKR